MTTRKASEEDLCRFYAKVSDTSDPDACWIWSGAKSTRGYGQFWFDGRKHQAHRFMWEQYNGQTLAKGIDACHTCDVTLCVNPRHIWPGSRAENMTDALAKGRLVLPPRDARGNLRKTHCKHGHPFSAPGQPGVTRRCPVCKGRSPQRRDSVKEG